MTIFEDIAYYLLSTAYFIDKWFYHIVIGFAAFYIFQYFFIKDWDVLLCKAVNNSDVKAFNEALNKGADVNFKWSGEKTALMLSAQKENVEMIKSLLGKKNINVNIQDEDGKTALIFAAEVGNAEAVRYLLAGKADMKLSSNDGTSPLLIACAKGHAAVVRMLLSRGADPNWKNKYGMNSLNVTINTHHAEGGRMTIIENLLSPGSASSPKCNIESKSLNGWTPLIRAAYKGYLPIVEYLVKHGANVNAAAENGFTSVIAAAQNGWIEVMKYLIHRGADCSLQLFDGSTALIAASYGGYVEIVELLLKQPNVNVNHRYKSGSSALMAATVRGFVDIAQLLLAHGIDVNIANEDGRDALMVACDKGFGELCQLLLDSGANPNRMNNDAYAPVMYACKYGYLEMLKTLLKHGAELNHCPAWIPQPNVTNLDKKEEETPAEITEEGEKDEKPPVETAENAADSDGKEGETDKKEANIASAAVPPRDERALLDGYLPPLMLAILLPKEHKHKAETIQLLLDNGADANINMTDYFHTFGLRDIYLDAAEDLKSGKLSKAAFLEGLDVKEDELNSADPAAAMMGAAGASSTGASAAGQAPAAGGGKKGKKYTAEEEDQILSDLEDTHTIYQYFSTPLLLAAYMKDETAVRLLLPHVTNVNDQNLFGHTVTTVVAQLPCMPILLMVLEHGAVQRVADEWGLPYLKICWQLAKKLKFWHLGRVLFGGGKTYNSGSKGKDEKVKKE